MILDGGDTLMGIAGNMGKKKLAGALRSLKRWKNLFMANVRT